jgi:hypothetical protein
VVHFGRFFQKAHLVTLAATAESSRTLDFLFSAVDPMREHCLGFLKNLGI